MMGRGVVLVMLGLLVAGCEDYSAPRYSMSADSQVALKGLGTVRINVGDFHEPKQFGPGCRAAGPITASDKLGFAAYIRKALVDELKVAGLYNETSAVTLTGEVDKLAFSSTVGSWDIGLVVTSSNGKSLAVEEHYSFPTAFAAVNACKRVADAYAPAVQDLIQKLVSSPAFRSLIQG